MGRITTGIGLVSGINSKDIIDQLMALERRPVDLLKTRIDAANQRKAAFTDLGTGVNGLKTAADLLKKPSTFQNAIANSSDENVITATATKGAAPGSYEFQVARLVTSQQSVSTGFATYDRAPVGAGTITIEEGGGEVSTQTPLAQLNGNQGVRRGAFRITDRAGSSAVIDITAAVTLDDVIKKINTTLDVNVHASAGPDGLILTDLTGKTAGDLVVQDLADGSAARDLGIAQDVAGNTLSGTSINYLSRATSLEMLNDGRGVRHAASGDDFSITTADGTVVRINLALSNTLGDAIDAINTAGGGKVVAALATDGKSLKLTDATSGGGTLTVTDIGSKAGKDLGLENAPAGNIINGSRLSAGLNTVLLSSLKGGAGLAAPGTISITDRAGVTTPIDLSGAQTVQDILDKINKVPGIRVVASLKASGNGIQISDISGGTGNLTIADVSGTSAADLGLSGTFDSSIPAAQGANLQRQWVTENSLLSTLNGGKGVGLGKIKLTNSAGAAASVDLAGSKNVGDIINAINAKNAGITASINANGDGILLTDTAGGSQKLTVADDGSTTAADLNLAGVATTTTIDGSYEKSLVITATDTLASIQTKINTLNFGVQGTIINDGTAQSPFRLSLTAKNTGREGRVVFDAGSTKLQTRNLVEAQDAAVFLGGSGAAEPLLITGSSNELSGIIPGVNVSLHGVSSRPVTVNVTRNADNAVTQVKAFTDGFNSISDKIKDLTKFDPDTQKGGPLLGDDAVQTVQDDMYAALSGVVSGAGRYRILADVGITLGDGAKITFDEDKFRAAYATDPDAVQKLFTLADNGLATVMSNKLNRVTDPVDGVIARQAQTIDNKNKDFQDRIDSLNKLLDTKRTRLEQQFSNMESVLSTLQSQQAALGSLTTNLNASASSSKK
ncbi:MAG TPA: flagellar filament capping protein FliD [Tepidisphaeraceae bacterium]|jgi:flagellar hook-associated protein 2